MSRRRAFSHRRSPNPFATRRSDGGILRTIGRVIIVVIVVAAVYLVVDFAGRVWAEAYVANEMQHALGLTTKPNVTFGGPLFVPQLLEGNLSSVTADAEDFTSNDVAFTSANLALDDIQFSPAKLLFHEGSTIVAKKGSGSATMTAQQLTDAFRAQGVPISVRFLSDGTVRVSASRFPGSVVIGATIEHGDLVLRPVRKPFDRFSFTLNLPPLLPGLTYTAIDFDGTLGTLSFKLNDATFSVPASK
ncbi:MAG TPA: DUF2993 domain-containing protein [Actinomycetota bacterium]|jgi:hypothetical protein